MLNDMFKSNYKQKQTYEVSALICNPKLYTAIGLQSIDTLKDEGKTSDILVTGTDRHIFNSYSTITAQKQ